MYNEFFPKGETVNQDFQSDVLRRLRENVPRKRPEFWLSGGWFLHNDNCDTYSALLCRNLWLKTARLLFPAGFFLSKTQVGTGGMKIWWHHHD